MLCVGRVSQVPQQCGAEVKLLLVASETQSAVTALSAGKKTTGQVHFFDTSSLNLLSQGEIVRLGQGTTADLTVKLRSPSEKKIIDYPAGATITSAKMT